ncbi:MAG TPA: PadR family transcriptional regulator [Thermoanaerobaculia bacterium]|nr:PadR family transcriptional regulator [Thermoanaerobaculia bacterium]
MPTTPTPERDSDSRRSQLIKGLSEMALLCVLRGGPRYGLELLERLHEEAGLEVADGTIYPLLHRLERAGLVAADWRTDTDNGRPRKYYAPTPSGEAELATMLAEWRALRAKLDRLTDGDKP